MKTTPRKGAVLSAASALIAFFLCTSVSYGQVNQFRWETSGSFSFQQYVEKNNNSSFLSVAFRPGIFVADPLQAELEAVWSVPDGPYSGYSFSLNLLLHPTSSSRYPFFILMGAGVTNGFAKTDIEIERVSEALCPQYNLGLGFKAFMTKHCALRWEYRFQYFDNWARYKEGTFNIVTSSATLHSLYFGFSFFFKEKIKNDEFSRERGSR